MKLFVYKLNVFKYGILTYYIELWEVWWKKSPRADGRQRNHRAHRLSVLLRASRRGRARSFQETKRPFCRAQTNLPCPHGCGGCEEAAQDGFVGGGTEQRAKMNETMFAALRASDLSSVFQRRRQELSSSLPIFDFSGSAVLPGEHSTFNFSKRAIGRWLVKLQMRLRAQDSFC